MKVTDYLEHDGEKIKISASEIVVEGEETKTVDKLLKEKANIKQEDWKYPTLQNGWVNVVNARYYKDELGRVHVEGYIKDGTTTNRTAIFTLTEGYRPDKNLYLLAGASGTGFQSPIYFEVLTNGQVLIGGGATQSLIFNFSFRAAD